MLPQVLQVGCGVKRSIGNVVDFCICFQVLFELLDDGQDRLFIRFVAGERLEEEWNSTLI